MTNPRRLTGPTPVRPAGSTNTLPRKDPQRENVEGLMKKGGRLTRPNKQRSHRRRRGHLRVDARPELRAEPDWDRFAWALLQYVRAKREAAESGRDRGLLT